MLPQVIHLVPPGSEVLIQAHGEDREIMSVYHPPGETIRMLLVPPGEQRTWVHQPQPGEQKQPYQIQEPGEHPRWVAVTIPVGGLRLQPRELLPITIRTEEVEPTRGNLQELLPTRQKERLPQQ